MRLNCKEVTRLLASEEWVTARWYDHLLGGLHLFLCDQCRLYKLQLESISKTAKNLWAPTEDSATLDRLKAEILKESDE